MKDDVASLGPRQMNRLRVLETLYRHPGSTRADLARRTGLSRATVSTLVDELGRAGVVAEHEGAGDGSEPGLAEEAPRASGRPPMSLSLVPGAAFAVGLDFGHQHIRVAVCDLSGEPVVDEWSPAEVDHAPVESLDLAHELVRGALRTASIERDRLVGVGMGLAAPINHLTGELEANGILPGWHGLRPAAEMQARLGTPVQLENDANVGALGEKAFGAARGVEDVIYIRLSAGIGAGLILGGRPYQGVLGVAGEVGHVLLDPAGPICRCGNRGCLETVASPVAVAALLERSTGQSVSVATLLELVAGGDRGARTAVADAGEAVGRALSMLVNALNPELVVVGGDLARAGEVLLEPIRLAIARHAVAPAARSVSVTAGALGDRAEVLGAAALILARSPRALVERVGS
ncbi:MAG: ROK family transcriptional regulator [Solirubrobacterales bacterium]|nr:ROK family transcriptional regulator [Solirubrobacterales bacterium]MBV9472345.1 ROK family transcriptional regulator [Solirubrobacterales bacterium]MBV9837947.1 ROK family transcriptional regulator [Solirubrobacterales bacterium]